MVRTSQYAGVQYVCAILRDVERLENWIPFGILQRLRLALGQKSSVPRGGWMGGQQLLT